jgi:hypothetical protein
MTIPKTNKTAEHERDAAHCLEMVRLMADQDRRVIQCETAAESLKLAKQTELEGVVVGAEVNKRSNGHAKARS